MTTSTRSTTHIALTAIALTTALLLGALPNTAAADDFRQADGKVVRLEATKQGDQIGAGGVVKIGDLEPSFAVLVIAKVADGTQLLIEGRTKGGELFDIGTVRMVLGAGTLDVANPPFRLDQLAEVVVSRKGTVLLKAKI
jgi:hypothetical protein